MRGVTGEPVNSENKGRGYEIGKDQFLMVEDEELEAIQVEGTHTIEIDSFVPRDQIDERYLDSPYYIAPTDKIGQEAFAVIREAMRDKKMAGIGRVVIARRERPIMLEPFGKGVLGTTLRYPYEVRAAEGYFEDVQDIKLSDEIRELAAHILETKRADFDPARFEDRYETAVVAMLKSKQAGMPMQAKAPTPRPANIVNLIDALRRSIAAQKPARAPSEPEGRKPPAPAKAGRRPQGRTSKRA